MAASGPHSGHPRASEHAFFPVVGDTFAHPILRTPHLRTRPVPLLHPRQPCWAVPRAISEHCYPVSWPIKADLVGEISHCVQKMSAASPPKHLPTAIWWCLKMYVYERIRTYMHVSVGYVLECMYMHVYARMYIYARIN